MLYSSAMRILIATGVYPPDIGGPAQYAKNLESVWKKQGHVVTVKFFRFERKLPSGFRHLWYFVKILPAVFFSDFILALDTFSVALPTLCVARLCGRKVVLRMGGDFLWESYVERTSDLVLLREFYKTRIEKFSNKERFVFFATKWILHRVSAVVFSTEWQETIWYGPYDLASLKTDIVENYYGPKEGDVETDLRPRTFVAASRDLKWKNVNTVKRIFNKPGSKIPRGVDLLTEESEFGRFMKIIKESYAVLLVSLGDISPNIILDAIRYNRPFICTKEVGIFDRVKDAGKFVDPLNETEIEQAILSLLDKAEYEKARQKVRDFSFTHTWEQIAGEFFEIFQKIK